MSARTTAEQWISLRQAAARAGLTYRVMLGLVHDGAGPAGILSPRGRYRVRVSVLDAWLRAAERPHSGPIRPRLEAGAEGPHAR
jgi:hypothetical protein